MPYYNACNVTGPAEHAAPPPLIFPVVAVLVLVKKKKFSGVVKISVGVEVGAVVTDPSAFFLPIVIVCPAAASISLTPSKVGIA